jgi:flavin reductase (DIM6/NTAB) family NADH-FMN oxidoreductase RutF/rubredoxin
MNFEAYFKITYGLYVVSSIDGNKLNGYISNTVFQVTAEPPQIAIACSKNNFTAGMIERSKVFTVSALQKETRPELIGAFGYRSGRDIDKFADFTYKTGITGAPVLLDDTIAWFECNVLQTHDVGSHLLFIGQVIDGDLINVQGEPLTYAFFRDIKKGKAPKNAPTYVDPEKLSASIPVIKTIVYECPACGYLYDPLAGDPDSGIPAGTRFEDLPEDWLCPSCGIEKKYFLKKKD